MIASRRHISWAISRENVQIIARVYFRLVPRRVFPVDALDPGIELHPDPEASWVGVDRAYRGRDGIREYLGVVPAAFADYHPEIERFLDIDDTVVTLAVESGGGRGSGAQVQSA